MIKLHFCDCIRPFLECNPSLIQASLLQYLICGSSSTLALPSSQLLRGTLLLRHPPDPLLLHFLAAAHTQAKHHPSCMHVEAHTREQRCTQGGKAQCHRCSL